MRERQRRGEAERVAQIVEIRRHGCLAEDAKTRIHIGHITTGRELDQKGQNEPQQRLAEGLAIMLALPRADHHVEPFAVAIQQLLQIPDRIGPIRIHDDDRIVLGGLNSGLDRGAITQIVGMGDDNGTAAFRDRTCLVTRAIIDNDDFRIRANPGPVQAIERGACIANSEFNRPLLIVGRDHN